MPSGEFFLGFMDFSPFFPEYFSCLLLYIQKIFLKKYYPASRLGFILATRWTGNKHFFKGGLGPAKVKWVQAGHIHSSLQYMCSVYVHCVGLGPSLSEKLFPVRRVTAKKARLEVGNFFSFLFLILHSLECTEKIENKKCFFQKS